jgi:serine/threonine protein kinase
LAFFGTYFYRPRSLTPASVLAIPFNVQAMGCAHSVTLEEAQDGAGARFKPSSTRGCVPSAAVCDLSPDTSKKVDLGKGRTQPVAVAKPTFGTREQFVSEYELHDTLGKGSFGIVVSAFEKRSRRMEAVKIVDSGSNGSTPTSSRTPVEDAAMKRKWKLAVQEVEVWRAVGEHANVVELHKMFYDNRVIFMVMERCECTVAEKVDSNPDLLQSGLKDLLRQMLLGVEACHQASVAHRDIKPDNYLIGLDGSTVKLGDFNLSAVQPPNGSFTGEFGTAPFMSPEMLTARHGIGTDVWSYGVMAYFMFFGELPYIPQEVTSKAAKDVIRAGVPVPRYLEKMHRNRCSDSMSFCSDLLQRDPSLRCSASDASGHSYFKATFDAKKDLAMIDTQDTLDPFEPGTLESDDDDKSEISVSEFSQQDDSENGELLGLSTEA